MKNLKFIYIILFVGLFVFGGFFVGNKKENIPTSSKINNGLFLVTRVIDGDTIEVSLDDKKETVRLIGIDAPETADPRIAIECFGKEASSKAKEILTGRIIILESDPTQGDRDKYGRFLRYVFLDDLNFNKLMISEGYAHEYTYQNNPYKYMEEFRNAEKIAREEQKGFWSDVVKCNNE